MRITLLSLLVLGIVGATSAQALTLKEKKQYQAWKTWLADPAQSNIGAAKDKCGYAIPFTLDQALTTPFMEESSDAAAYCDELYNALAETCGDDTGKQAVKAKVTKITCKLGKKEEVSFALSKTGVLKFTFGVGAANLKDKAKKFLEDNL